MSKTSIFLRRLVLVLFLCMYVAIVKLGNLAIWTGCIDTHHIYIVIVIRNNSQMVDSCEFIYPFQIDSNAWHSFLLIPTRTHITSICECLYIERLFQDIILWKSTSNIVNKAHDNKRYSYIKINDRKVCRKCRNGSKVKVNVWKRKGTRDEKKVRMRSLFLIRLFNQIQTLNTWIWCETKHFWFNDWLFLFIDKRVYRKKSMQTQSAYIVLCIRSMNFISCDIPWMQTHTNAHNTPN